MLNQRLRWLSYRITDGLLQGLSFGKASLEECPEHPQSIFILRNNDLGDLLVITPLFEALHRKFPQAKLGVGVGKWNLETLKFNPYISEIIEINAPWFNKAIPQQYPWNALEYILFSPESQAFANRHFEVGIDILGSYWGSLLMLRGGIPYRLGVRGYAGGHTAVQQFVEYNPQERVSRSALRFAELLGAVELPECTPQIFLSLEEKKGGEECWHSQKTRLAIAPGSGLEEKYWPLDHYIALTQTLSQGEDLEIVVVGGKQDRQAGQALAAISPQVRNLAGTLSLRETFALVAAGDIVVCNSSMLMHAAAAFAKPTVVLLGESFASAAQHDAQWGYDRSYWCFGKEGEDRDRIYSPTEAIAAIKRILLQLRSH